MAFLISSTTISAWASVAAKTRVLPGRARIDMLGQFLGNDAIEFLW